MLYFAYGSNLNKAQMSRRCPAAIPIGALILRRARLVFRGVADVEATANDSYKVDGGLWHVTKQCERALDSYEGVSGGLYRKSYFQVNVTRKGVVTKEPVLIYQMNRSDYSAPSRYYYDSILCGFGDFGLDAGSLIESANRSVTGDYAPINA